MKNTIKQHSLLFIITVFSLSFTSCLKYFRTNTIKAAPPQYIIDSIYRERKMVIVHYADKVIELNDISVNGDTISGIPVEISEVTARYSKPFQNKSNFYKKIHYAEVLSQVHLYINEMFPLSSPILILTLDKISRYDIYTFDKKATKDSMILGTVLLLIAGIGIFTFLIIAIQGLNSLVWVR